MPLSPTDVKSYLYNKHNITDICKEIDSKMVETIYTNGGETVCKVWLSAIYPDHVNNKIIELYKQAGWPTVSLTTTSNQRDGESTCIEFFANLNF